MDPLLPSRDERFHEAFRVSPVGNVIIRCSDATIIEINAACLRILGCERHELVGRPATALRFSPAIALDEDQDGAPAQREITFIRKDGSSGHGLYFHHPMDLRGERHALATLIDITERKQMEQSLRESSLRLAATLEGGRMGTWIWDTATGQMWWDDAATVLWGRKPGETMPQPIDSALQFIHPDDRPRVANGFVSYLQSGAAGKIEFRTVRPDGALQWIAVRIGAQRPEWHRAGRLIGIFVDVTAEKRAEEAQMRSQKMDALATLAGGIAHDFNNILLAISGNTRLASTDLPQNHPVQHNLGQIAQASSRAADLVRRILAFSRQQEGRREVRSLKPILQQAVRLLRHGLPASIELRAQLGDAPLVAVDALQIQEILTNLTANAVHAIGDGRGIIDLALHPASIEPGIPGLSGGDYACLSFRDNGSGMDRQTLERIFDPFFTTRPASAAAGLGLSVVHGIVQNLGGTILVDSTPGEGTKFDIYFRAAQREEQPVQPAREPSRGQGQRVLYVDDEEALVILLTRVLERLGYSVLSFTDPVKALAAVQDDPHCVDVVVTDLSMHGMSGIDLARAILATRPDLPVLLTSGYVRAEDRESAHACGIREVILKPNTVEELGHALNRLFSDYARP